MGALLKVAPCQPGNPGENLYQVIVAKPVGRDGSLGMGEIVLQRVA